MPRPAPLDVRERVKGCGNKAGNPEYVRSVMVNCADIEVIREALLLLDETQKREATPLEVEVVHLRELVALAERLLTNPTYYWAEGGKDAWAAARARGK